MKKMLLLVFMICVCLLTGCNNNNSNDSLLSRGNDDSAMYELVKPDEVQEIAEDQKVQWMAGMLPKLENAEIVQELSTDHRFVYTDPGDVIKASLTVQNGLDRVQRFELMVVADGIPIEFIIEGKTYKTYPIDLTSEQKTILMEINNDFSLNLGRLDFVMSYTENLQGSFHMARHTLWIDLAGETAFPTALCDAVEQRELIRTKYSGNAHDAWIWNEGKSIADTDDEGPRMVSLQNGETIVLEVVATTPGLYRTVLVVGDTPVEFELNGTKHSYLDWEATGTNMLQLPIKIENLPQHGSLYTINTPLDSNNIEKQIIASRRIELIVGAEE